MIYSNSERNNVEIDRKELRSRALIVSGALDMTRLKRKLRRACMLVLIEGYANHEAAKKVGVSRQNVYRALKRLKPKLAEVEAHVRELVR